MLTVCDSLDVSDIVHKVVGGASWSMGGLAVTRKIHTHDRDLDDYFGCFSKKRESE